MPPDVRVRDTRPTSDDLQIHDLSVLPIKRHSSKPINTAFLTLPVTNRQHNSPMSLTQLPTLAAPKPMRGHPTRVPAFGCFSPSWTIGSSRRPPRPPLDCPGPADYDTVMSMRSPRGGKSMSWKPAQSDRTVTSDVDVPNIRPFPTPRRLTVGQRSSTFFYYPVDGAATLIVGEPAVTGRGCTIGRRIPERPNENPGPGAYSPDYSQRPKLATIDRGLDRDAFKDPDPSLPPPGSYDVQGPIKTPRWFRNRRITREDDDD
jgi:hypothetical protein